MKIKTKASGYMTINVLRKGKIIEVCKRRKNLVLNGAFQTAGGTTWSNSFYAHTDGSANYEDLDGTWSQSGNTVTRSSGTGTFPASPTQPGNEILWETGERCHVTARASDTSITVSGPARTITGKRIRRFRTNLSWTSGAAQSKNSTSDPVTTDRTTGIYSRTVRAVFDSALSAYTLRSMALQSCGRVVLDTPFDIEIDDQIQVEYTLEVTVSNRSRTYEISTESSGVPRKYNCLTIVGDGTKVDVTFDAATNFLAGDKIDLRNVITKKAAISSASSTSTTLTINTSAAHGLSPGDSVTVEDASLSGYNGVKTVATVPTSTSLTITDAANPGAMGAAGTVRLTTPGTYFDDLGLATIASMPSSSVARITSAIQGPAVNPMAMNGDPGATVTAWNGLSGNMLSSGSDSNSVMYYFSEANAKTIPAVTSTSALSTTNGVAPNTRVRTATATYNNDFTTTYQGTWNAGTGTGQDRIKQVLAQPSTLSDDFCLLITFNTPQQKLFTDRFRLAFSMQNLRELLPDTF